MGLNVTWSRDSGAWRLVSAVATFTEGTRVGVTPGLLAALRAAGIPITNASS